MHHSLQHSTNKKNNNQKFNNKGFTMSKILNFLYHTTKTHLAIIGLTSILFATTTHTQCMNTPPGRFLAEIRLLQSLENWKQAAAQLSFAPCSRDLAPHNMRNIAEAKINNEQVFIQLVQSAFNAGTNLLTDLANIKYETIEGETVEQLCKHASIQELTQTWQILKNFLIQITDTLREKHEIYHTDIMENFYHATCNLFNDAEKFVAALFIEMRHQEIGTFISNQNFTTLQTKIAPMAERTATILQTINKCMTSASTTNNAKIKLHIEKFDALVASGAPLAQLNREAVAILLANSSVLTFIGTIAQETNFEPVKATMHLLFYILANAPTVLADDTWFNQLSDDTKNNLMMLEMALIKKLSIVQVSHVISDTIAEINKATA